MEAKDERNFIVSVLEWGGTFRSRACLGNRTFYASINSVLPSRHRRDKHGANGLVERAKRGGNEEMERGRKRARSSRARRLFFFPFLFECPLFLAPSSKTMLRPATPRQAPTRISAPRAARGRSLLTFAVRGGEKEGRIREERGGRSRGGVCLVLEVKNGRTKSHREQKFFFLRLSKKTSRGIIEALS